MTDVLGPTSENLSRVGDCVRAGGVVVAPSDTNMAVTVDPRSPEAIDRAYAAKDRPTHKPLTLFIRDPTEWRQFGSHENPAVVDQLIEAFWPGPLNLVLERAGTDLDDRLYRDRTISIGCLSNPVWRKLAAEVDGPLAMTSANESGTVPDDTLVDVEMALDHVGDDVDMVLAGEPQGTTRASTILSLASEQAGKATILRRGDVSAEAIETAGELSVG
jgi:L-threonylcarbamoyladenylate synthase